METRKWELSHHRCQYRQHPALTGRCDHYKAAIEDGRLQLRGVEKEYGNEVDFNPDDAFAGHLSSIIDHLPPVNGVNDVTPQNRKEATV